MLTGNALKSTARFTALPEIRQPSVPPGAGGPESEGANGNPATNRAQGLPLHVLTEDRAMTHTMAGRIALGVSHFLEHAAAVALGIVLMIVGLGLGVTMIMLPVGVVIGLVGVLLVVGGVFARIDER